MVGGGRGGGVELDVGASVVVGGTTGPVPGEVVGCDSIDGDCVIGDDADWVNEDKTVGAGVPDSEGSRIGVVVVTTGGSVESEGPVGTEGSGEVVSTGDGSVVEGPVGSTGVETGGSVGSGEGCEMVGVGSVDPGDGGSVTGGVSIGGGSVGGAPTGGGSVGAVGSSWRRHRAPRRSAAGSEQGDILGPRKYIVSKDAPISIRVGCASPFRSCWRDTMTATPPWPTNATSWCRESTNLIPQTYRAPGAYTALTIEPLELRPTMVNASRSIQDRAVVGAGRLSVTQ